MLLQQTLENLRLLRLHGMIRAVEEQRASTAIQGMSFDERLGLIVDTEISTRENNKLKRILKAAKLKINACPEDIDFRASRGLDREIVANLVTCDWIEKYLNIIITGSTGVGKTWLSCALGQQAARKGYTVLYKRLSRLLEELIIAYGDGRLVKLRAKYAKVDLLILDDWALAPLTTLGRHELLELIDDRTGAKSTIITSQLPIDQWHEYLGEPTVADALVDRIVQRSHRLELHGESLRRVDSLMINSVNNVGVQ